MPDVHTHEIVLRGRLGHHLAGPFLDDFTIDLGETGVTRLVGTLRDPAHLHGLVAYLASINAQLISITPVTPNPITPVTPNPITPVTSTTDTRSTS
jgi:hypothetical protein